MDGATTAAFQRAPVEAPADIGLSVRLDQLDAIRRSVSQAMLINILIGFAILAVTIHAGNGHAGFAWFAVSTAANLGRIALCRAPCRAFTPALPEADVVRSIERHLRLGCVAALLSGFVWALLPVLCEAYTSSHAMFYIVVTCGIAAGAVTYGIGYALIPICFLTLPLLSCAGCLIVTGGFDRVGLGITILVYLAALIRGARQAEAVFRAASRGKNEAQAAAASRELARADATALAAEMERRATHDDLTGLLNRAGFAAAVESWSRRCPRHPCLMLLDLDGFKSVNDLCGHEVGDRVLTQVARRIHAALPPVCLAARLGGDEFAVFFDAAQTDEAPPALATRLIGIVAAPFDGFEAGHLGLCIGIDATGRGTLTRMLSRADEALYAAKAAGRNRIHAFDDALRLRQEMHHGARRDLAVALAEGRAEVRLQPIFAQNGTVLSGFEALLRWEHPDYGWIPPNDIVALAGREGLADHLLRFTVERSCSVLRSLADGGRGDLTIAVNVTPREMAQSRVDVIVLEQLRRQNLSPGTLCVEITEETPLDIEAVRDKLLALSRAGIRIAVDDFGTGYSSLASLHQLHAHRVKIDRSLVANLADDGRKRSMVEAVLGLGRSLGLDVVAEGVETQADLDVLCGLGCPHIQGFLLGRPMTIAAALSIAGIETRGAA